MCRLVSLCQGTRQEKESYEPRGPAPTPDIALAPEGGPKATPGGLAISSNTPFVSSTRTKGRVLEKMGVLLEKRSPQTPPPHTPSPILATSDAWCVCVGWGGVGWGGVGSSYNAEGPRALAHSHPPSHNISTNRAKYIRIQCTMYIQKKQLCKRNNCLKKQL